VVDDVKSNRKMLVQSVRHIFEHIEEAEDGLQAVEKVKVALQGGKVIHVIFMDFVMPNMDGPTAVSEIRSLGFEGAIFGVTGNSLTSDVQLFFERGASKVFLKPLDVSELERSLIGGYPFIIDYLPLRENFNVIYVLTDCGIWIFVCLFVLSEHFQDTVEDSSEQSIEI